VRRTWKPLVLLVVALAACSGGGSSSSSASRSSSNSQSASAGKLNPALTKKFQSINDDMNAFWVSVVPDHHLDFVADPAQAPAECREALCLNGTAVYFDSAATTDYLASGTDTTEESLTLSLARLHIRDYDAKSIHSGSGDAKLLNIGEVRFDACAEGAFAVHWAAIGNTDHMQRYLWSTRYDSFSTYPGASIAGLEVGINSGLKGCVDQLQQDLVAAAAPTTTTTA
jgi:hypothetical protein